MNTPFPRLPLRPAFMLACALFTAAVPPAPAQSTNDALPAAVKAWQDMRFGILP